MRSRSYRRAQQKRMIEKARHSRTGTNTLALEKAYGWKPKAGYLKSIANNLAVCSCTMCTYHKKYEESIEMLKTNVSTRQHMEDHDGFYCT